MQHDQHINELDDILHASMFEAAMIVGNLTPSHKDLPHNFYFVPSTTQYDRNVITMVYTQTDDIDKERYVHEAIDSVRRNTDFFIKSINVEYSGIKIDKDNTYVVIMLSVLSEKVIGDSNDKFIVKYT